MGTMGRGLSQNEKTMGKPCHEKTMGKPWENHGETIEK